MTRDRAQRKQSASLTIDGQEIPLTLRLNRRARRFIVRVDPATREVIVVSPSKRSTKIAVDFAREQTKWIAEQLASMPAPIPFLPDNIIPYRGVPHIIRHDALARRGVWQQPAPSFAGPLPEICVSGGADHVSRRVRDWLRKEARAQLAAHCLDHARALDLGSSRISVRDTKSRWGSCSPTGDLSFSWRLILAPAFVLDYVAAHETAHRVHMNHSAAFWRVVERLVPRRQDEYDWLNEYGNDLHRFGANMPEYLSQES